MYASSILLVIKILFGRRAMFVLNACLNRHTLGIDNIIEHLIIYLKINKVKILRIKISIFCTSAINRKNVQDYNNNNDI